MNPYSHFITRYLIFFILIFLFTHCTQNDSDEVLSMENAPWGKEYLKYFKNLEKEGILIRDKNDTSVYYGIIDKDSITLVVNGIKWPTRKLVMVELFLGSGYGNRSLGGLVDKRFKNFDAEDTLIYKSGYSYKNGTKKSNTLYNRCKKMYNRLYGEPIITKLPSLFTSADGKGLVRYNWRSNLRKIREDIDSSFMLTYPNLEFEIERSRDSIALTLKPMDIVTMESKSSPDIKFVGNKCILSVHINEVRRIENCFKENITAVQYDLVFKDDFDNETFRVSNLQYKIEGDGLSSKVSGEFPSVPNTSFKLEGTYNQYQDEFKRLARMEANKNYKPPTIEVTAVLFNGGRIVKL